MDMKTAIQKLIHYYDKNIKNLDMDIIKKDPYKSKCKIKLSQ